MRKVGRSWTRLDEGRIAMQPKGDGEVKGSMREVMPETAAFIDACRAQFGRDVIDAIIMRAKRGDPVFHAAEIGPDGQLRQFGTARRGQVVSVSGGKVVRRGP